MIVAINNMLNSESLSEMLIQAWRACTATVDLSYL